MAWHQLELEKAHIAYACVGIFSTIFSLLSLFVKERLYIGEATVATVAGLILGPHCLDWFNPLSWGDAEYITLEICRIVLCIQIVAVAVELPRKYMKTHWLSVTILLLPVMTCGWLIVGLFIWLVIPHFNYADALLVSACVTATDPILAAAVVGKGKFAERVPGHLRNLLSAESGCNDGMAFPFIFLSLNMVLYPGNVHKVFKEWFLLTILWECIFGCLLGAVIGYVLRKAVAFAEKKNLIDRESFLAIFVFIAFNSAGIGSMLGVDDLLVSFAAGTAFGWNGDFAKKTEESHVSTVIDLLLNLAFFVYFGAIVPWPSFNDGSLGLNCWRLIILAIVIIFLRRVPAVVALKPFTPDIKTWREAFFCGHFGPIGVGAIFAAILARRNLEEHYSEEVTPLNAPPLDTNHPHYLLLANIWPIVCFLVITSIVVHGSSVAVLTLGKRLNRMAITMSFTTTNTQDQGPAWLSRLQLDKVSTSFSLQRVDTQAPSVDENPKLQLNNTIETSGIKVRPAGGAKRRKHKKQKKRRTGGDVIKKTLSRVHTDYENESPPPERHRPQTEFLQLGRTTSVTQGSPPSNETVTKESYDDSSSQDKLEMVIPTKSRENSAELAPDNSDEEEQSLAEKKGVKEPIPTTAFQEGKEIIIEDQHGEVIESLPLREFAKKHQAPELERSDSRSIHSMESLTRRLTQFSSASENSSIQSPASPKTSIDKRLHKVKSHKKRAFINKGQGHRKVYAHQVDNLIVIENEDGEIIRRYRVNPHSSQQPRRRSRSGSIMGKALSYVGIKSKNAEASADAPEGTSSDIPAIKVTNEISPKDLLTVEHDSDHPDSPLKDPDVTSRVENKLTEILTKAPQKSGRNLTIADAVRQPSTVDELSEEDEDQSEDSEDSEVEDDDEDEILNETEVEKRRRLAALGLSRRNESDEEE